MTIIPVVVLGILFSASYVSYHFALGFRSARAARKPLAIITLVLWVTFFCTVVYTATTSPALPTQLPTL